jgi:hypothetical protein
MESTQLLASLSWLYINMYFLSLSFGVFIKSIALVPSLLTILASAPAFSSRDIISGFLLKVHR